MSCLLKISAIRHQLSVSEKKLADFILTNAHLLRDYSSSQLASAVGVSQSSVVKFSQKLGYRGYPDLKLAINESIARGFQGESAPQPQSTPSPAGQPLTQLKQALLAQVDELNDPRQQRAAAQALASAQRVLVLGQGFCQSVAAAWVDRLALLGLASQSPADPLLQWQLCAQLGPGTVLFVIAMDNASPELHRAVRRAKAQGAKVVVLCRYNLDNLWAHADIRLYCLAGNPPEALSLLLEQCAQQHLLDCLFLTLLEDKSLAETFQQCRNALKTLEP